MNTALLLHRTAMEYYDLAGIYKAKGQAEFFDDYREKAWLLEKIAAFQMLTTTSEDTFKYIIIRSAGALGYEQGNYEEATKILELGLLANPPILEKMQMEEIMAKIKKKNTSKPSNTKDLISLSGVLTSADIEENLIKIKTGKAQKNRTIHVPEKLIKGLLKFYLGELVFLQLDLDASGAYHLKHIRKAA